MISDRLVALTTSPAFRWWIENVASRLDPWLFRATNGRLTSMGPPTVPMITLTTIGRRSGRPHPVHLAYVPHGDGLLVVASAMGQSRHPAWRYNLEANSEIEVQARGERFRARARLLGDAEKAVVWPELERALPQLAVYAARTERNIRVFSLIRCGAPSAT